MGRRVERAVLVQNRSLRSGLPGESEHTGIIQSAPYIEGWSALAIPLNLDCHQARLSLINLERHNRIDLPGLCIQQWSRNAMNRT